jgi:hypothetical protein
VLLGRIAVNRREAHWGGQLANPLMRILLCKVCITKMHGNSNDNNEIKCQLWQEARI